MIGFKTVKRAILSHGDLTGVGASDHHAQVHDHSEASEGGQTLTAPVIDSPSYTGAATSGLNMGFNDIGGLAKVALRNPADTFEYTVTPGAIAADRILNLPVLTGTDTLAVLGLAQTFTGTKTFSSFPLLPVSNPTQGRQAAHKDYVDGQDAHDRAARAYCTVASDGTLQANSFNIDTVVKLGTGSYQVGWDVNFANANYACMATVENGFDITVLNPLVGRIDVSTLDGTNAASDRAFHLAAFGDQ